MPPGAPPPVVVLVEDEPHIRRFLRTALVSAGALVHEADGFQAGLRLLKQRPPDLAIVDLGLPDGDGVDLIGQVRAWSAMPILVLSARSAEEQKVAALDAGGDDYLTKPFGVAELLARVRALLRRAVRPPVDTGAICTFGDVSVDLQSRTITRAGAPVHLTPIEYKLLGLLIGNAGRVVTHRRLLTGIWGPDRVDQTQYLRVHMAGLRRKLEDNPAMPKHILTESGVGYRLKL
ncbi:response regulator [Nitrogeniibacter mangrovi]|uniref:Response regulator n=2 Tax=Nitrogeniibacter mangrovi TaxID=2016596 RepID=A0A6C1BAM2_9RHOO|nr:response regulator [Nitrogeniibacter mangrovi]